jgi:hypothetical protein
MNAMWFSSQENIFFNNYNFSADVAQQLEKTKIAMDESNDSQKVGQSDLQYKHTSTLALQLHCVAY